MTDKRKFNSQVRERMDLFGESYLKARRAVEAPPGTVRTYWNGEPTPCVRVKVVVGKAPETWWCVKLEGTTRAAVKVMYKGAVYYLDNENGSAWLKVTTGRGGPNIAHNSLPISKEERIP